jgi:hypothetical protein
MFGIVDGHGKSGALVAQLTAQLLPAILQRNIRKAFAGSPSPSSNVTVDSAVPASATPTVAASSSLLSPPRSSTAALWQPHRYFQRTTLHSPCPRIHPGMAIGGSHMSPLQLQIAVAVLFALLACRRSIPPHCSSVATLLPPPVSAAVAIAASPSPTQGGPPGSEVGRQILPRWTR